MPKKEFIMRGQTASGETEVLEFGGKQKETRGYAYRLKEFVIYPSTNMLTTNWEMVASLTAGKVILDPQTPDFSFDGLIGTAYNWGSGSQTEPRNYQSVINDLFLITQNLTIVVQDTSSNPVNWQCKFESVKMSGPEEAATNYKQFAIFDG